MDLTNHAGVHGFSRAHSTCRAEMPGCTMRTEVDGASQQTNANTMRLSSGWHVPCRTPPSDPESSV